MVLFAPTSTFFLSETVREAWALGYKKILFLQLEGSSIKTVSTKTLSKYERAFDLCINQHILSHSQSIYRQKWFRCLYAATVIYHPFFLLVKVIVGHKFWFYVNGFQSPASTFSVVLMLKRLSEVLFWKLQKLEQQAQFFSQLYSAFSQKGNIANN